MTSGGERAVGVFSSTQYPVLLECDGHGNVLWMSDHTRAVLGPIGNLVEAVPGEGTAVMAVCLRRLWESGGRILLGGRSPDAAEEESLLRLQVNLLFHYVRLDAAEKSLSRARDRLRPARGAVRQLEEERRRLGRELHTSVGQLLSAMRLQLEVIARELPDGSPAVRQALDRMATLSAEALEQVRSISRSLHPPAWQTLPLESALRQLWDLSGIPQRFASTLHLEPLPRQPALDAKVVIYRGAQEAFSNVARHANATRVSCTLEAQGDFVVLRFEDNGVGFDAARLFSAAPDLAAGIGLRTIREQAEALGGRLRVTAGAQGATVEVAVPFEPVE